MAGEEKESLRERESDMEEAAVDVYQTGSAKALGRRQAWMAQRSWNYRKNHPNAHKLRMERLKRERKQRERLRERHHFGAVSSSSSSSSSSASSRRATARGLRRGRSSDPSAKPPWMRDVLSRLVALVEKSDSFGIFLKVRVRIRCWFVLALRPLPPSFSRSLAAYTLLSAPQPVPRSVTGYYAIIRRPMDLSRCKSKIKAGAYDIAGVRGLFVFSLCVCVRVCVCVCFLTPVPSLFVCSCSHRLADLELMCNNCIRFNHKGTVYHAEGLRTKALALRLSHEVVADLCGEESKEAASLRSSAEAAAAESEKMATAIEEAEKREAEAAALASGE